MMSQYVVALACVGLVSLPSVSCSRISLRVPDAASAGGVGTNSVSTAFLVTNSFIADTVSGWSSLTGSVISSFPAHYTANTFSSLVSQHIRIPSQSQVTYECNNVDSEPCNVVVFFFSCFPCASAKGSITMVLGAAGFERTRCAPTFTTGVPGGIQHRMVGYVKTIAHGAVEEIELDGDLEFAMFGLSNGNGVDCSAITSDTMCTDSTNGLCEWTLGECRLATCVQAGPSPLTGCATSTCPLTELA